MYYINPWVFYIIDLVTNIQIACACVAIIGVVVWLAGFLAGPAIIEEITDTKEKEESYFKTFWKWMKKIPFILIISVVVCVITPSEATIYKMMIASKISTDDVDHVIERLDDVVDSIIESKEQADDSAD